MTINPVLAALSQARLRAAPVFVRWRELNGAGPCPAAPAVVARFVAECAPLGIDSLWLAVQEISKLYVSAGLADPTLGGQAAATIADVAKIEPPRSWPDNGKRRFRSLPYDVQIFIAAHESQREKALRRAQNDAAEAKKRVARLQQSLNETKPERMKDEGIPHSVA
jgi:hypothetical protein